MNGLLCAIYDRKAGYYLPVFQTISVAEACRAFNEIVVSSDTPIAKYPADFDLVSLGEIDLETGAITSDRLPNVLLNGLVALQAVHAERARYERVLRRTKEGEPALNGFDDGTAIVDDIAQTS